MESRSVLSTLTTSSSLISVPGRCHLGNSIVYDTVSNLSWSVDVRTHGIVNVIDKILSVPWAPSQEIGREVPEAKYDEDCVVGFLSQLSLVL